MVAVVQGSNINRAARSVRRAFVGAAGLLQLLVLIGLTADKALADYSALYIYKVQVFDGAKWHMQKLDPGTCWECTKSNWTFLTGTDWPNTVKVKVFWRWGLNHCYACPAKVFKDGSWVSDKPVATNVDGFKGFEFTYENQPKHASFNPSIKAGYASEFVSPTHIEVTLKTVPVTKLPWVIILSPAEGQTFQAGPIPVLIEVKSNIPKKPSTVRLEAQKKVGRTWGWAAPGTPDIPWASFPYTLPAPAKAGEYRIRVQGKKGSTMGVMSPWRTFKVQ